MTATIIGEVASNLFNLARFSQANLSGDYVSDISRKHEVRYEVAILMDLAFKNRASDLNNFKKTIQIARKNIKEADIEEYSVDSLDEKVAVTFNQTAEKHANTLFNVLDGLVTIFNTIQTYETDTKVLEYRTKKKLEDLYVCIDILAYTILNSRIEKIEDMYASFISEYESFLALVNDEKEVRYDLVERFVNY